jgi:hypothetical protein
MSPLTEAQVEGVRYVLACLPKAYCKILKVEFATEDAREDGENRVNSFRTMACQIHPQFNKAKGANKA